jgi:hypothetical protein
MSGDAIEEMEKSLNTQGSKWSSVPGVIGKTIRLLAAAKATRAMVERIEKACKENCACGMQNDIDSHVFSGGDCPACRVWARIHREDA